MYLRPISFLCMTAGMTKIINLSAPMGTRSTRTDRPEQNSVDPVMLQNACLIRFYTIWSFLIQQFLDTSTGTR